MSSTSLQFQDSLSLHRNGERPPGTIQVNNDQLNIEELVGTHKRQSGKGVWGNGARAETFVKKTKLMSFLQASLASWSCARNLGGGEAFWPGSVDGGIPQIPCRTEAQ